MKTFFESLFQPSVGAALSVQSVLVTIAFALICGIIVSLGYLLVCRKTGYSTYFVTSLVVLPVVISIIIMLIGSNIARAFSLGGVFALIRFRSEPGNPRDITYIAITMAAGLACGTGYIAYGVLFTVIIVIVCFLLELIGLGKHKNSAIILKITVPEDLDFERAFESVFEKYTKYHKLDRVKTADFGALYQIQFSTELKDDNQKKEFVDAIRTVNSNLTVSMSGILYEEGRKTF